MLDWTDEQKMLRDALREFALKEVVPLVGELEHGDLPPYDTLRKLFAAFGIDAMARDSFTKRLARTGRGDAAASGDGPGSSGFDPGSDARPHQRTVAVLPRHGHGAGRVGRPYRRGDRQPWHRDAAPALGARPPLPRAHRGLGADRAGSRLGRLRRHALHGATRPQRRRLHPQRVEDVHHQRTVRRRHRVHLQARRWHPARAAQGPVVRPRAWDGGARAVAAAAQDGDALLADGRGLRHRRARRH